MDHFLEMEKEGQISLFEIQDKTEVETEIIMENLKKNVEEIKLGNTDGKLTSRTNSSGFIEPKRMVIKVR